MRIIVTIAFLSLFFMFLHGFVDAEAPQTQSDLTRQLQLLRRLYFPEPERDNRITRTVSAPLFGRYYPESILGMPEPDFIDYLEDSGRMRKINDQIVDAMDRRWRDPSGKNPWEWSIRARVEITAIVGTVGDPLPWDKRELPWYVIGDPAPGYIVGYTDQKAEADTTPKPYGGFVSHGDGETRVVEDQPGPEGGFKPLGEGETKVVDPVDDGFKDDGFKPIGEGKTKVVEDRLEPNGGFTPISGETTSLTRQPAEKTQSPRPPGQTGWVRSNDGFSDDFNEPTFGDANIRPNRTWRPNTRPSRGRDNWRGNWVRPQYRPSPPVRTQRGGVGFMGGARRVSPDRARQLQRSFR
jgi:hypothetical protein